MKYIIYLLIYGGLLLPLSCSKYPDGPLISIRSKKERVTAEWEVTKFIIDGENLFYWESSDVLECTTGYPVWYNSISEVTSYTWHFWRDGTWASYSIEDYRSINYQLSYDNCTAIYENTEYRYDESGKWDLSSDKKKLELTWDNSALISNLDIIELRERRMKLAGEMDGAMVEITFEKK